MVVGWGAEMLGCLSAFGCVWGLGGKEVDLGVECESLSECECAMVVLEWVLGFWLVSSCVVV